MAVFVNSFFEKRLENLFDLARRVDAAFSAAGLDYRVVGGLATYLYVEEAAPDAGRLTKDIDITVRREDLEKIRKAVEPFGFEYRHVAGVDMLLQQGQPARRAVHLVFGGEKVRKEYVEAAPEMGPYRRIQGIPVVPLDDLVKMKLTSYRLKDQTHLKDLEQAGLLTPDIEGSLPKVLRERLDRVRSQE